MKYGVNKGEIHDIADDAFFKKQKDITLTTGLTEEAFDLTIPVTQNDTHVAYLLVGDRSEQEVRMSPIIKHMKFIQTLTNVLVGAIQNRKLQEESLRQERVKNLNLLLKCMQFYYLKNSLKTRISM